MLNTPTTGGFNSPRCGDRQHDCVAAHRARGALAGLIATVTLMAGTIVAATAVSIGIARADALGAILDNEGGIFAIALLLGTLFMAASLTKAMSPRRNARRDALRQNGLQDRFLSR